MGEIGHVVFVRCEDLKSLVDRQWELRQDGSPTTLRDYFIYGTAVDVAGMGRVWLNISQWGAGCEDIIVSVAHTANESPLVEVTSDEHRDEAAWNKSTLDARKMAGLLLKAALASVGLAVPIAIHTPSMEVFGAAVGFRPTPIEAVYPIGYQVTWHIQ